MHNGSKPQVLIRPATPTPRWRVLLAFCCLAASAAAQFSPVMVRHLYARFDTLHKAYRLVNANTGAVVSQELYDQVEVLSDSQRNSYYGYLVQRKGRLRVLWHDGLTAIGDTYDAVLACYGRSDLLIVRSGVQYALLSLTAGVLAQPGQFEAHAPLQGGLRVRKQNKEYAVLLHPTLQVSPGFDAIKSSYFPVAKNHFVAVQDGKWGISDVSGKALLPFLYDSLFISSHIHLLKDGKWGLADMDYKLLVDCQYDQLIPTPDGRYYQAARGGKWGLLDSAFAELLPLAYEGLLQAYENRDGDAASTWSQDHFLARLHGKWGVLTRSNTWRVPNAFDSITDLRHDHLYALKDGKMGVLDLKGKTMFPFRFEQVLRCDADFKVGATPPVYFVCRTPAGPSPNVAHRWGLADKKGRLLRPVESYKLRLVTPYTYRSDVNAERFFGYLDSSFVGYLWTTGGQLRFVPHVGDSTNQEIYSADGNPVNVRVPNTVMTGVLTGGRTGVMDRQGKLFIPQEYDDLVLRFVDDGHAAQSWPAALSDAWRLPAIQGNTYRVDTHFPLIARKGGQWGVINWRGQTLVPFNYDTIEWHSADVPWEAKAGDSAASRYRPHVFVLRQNGHFGYAATTGQTLTAVEFDGVLHKFLFRKTVVPTLREPSPGFAVDSATRAQYLERAIENASRYTYLQAVTRGGVPHGYSVQMRQSPEGAPAGADTLVYTAQFSYPKGAAIALLDGVGLEGHSPWAEDVLLLDRNFSPVQLSAFSDWLRLVGWHQYHAIADANTGEVLQLNNRLYGEARGPWYSLCFLKLEGKWFVYDLFARHLVNPSGGAEAIGEFTQQGYTSWNQQEKRKVLFSELLRTPAGR